MVEPGTEEPTVPTVPGCPEPEDPEATDPAPTEPAPTPAPADEAAVEDGVPAARESAA